MDARLLRLRANREHGVATSPGDETSIDSPTNPKKTVDIAVIHLHRFAFYYWLKWSTDEWSKSLPVGESPPDLVTIDYHNDVGADSDCIFKELRLLVGKLEVESPQNDKSLADANHRRTLAESNVAAYSVLGLNPVNDGQIFPAQYLNALGDVFVLYKQKGAEDSSFRDVHGNEHQIRWPAPQKLLQVVREFLSPMKGEERLDVKEAWEAS